jgi:hypothetical protein
MWDPTGNVPEWVRSQSSYSESSLSGSIYTRNSWSFLNYDYSYSLASLVGSYDDGKQIVQAYSQTKYETWNYLHGWSSVEIIVDPATGDDYLSPGDGGSEYVTFSDSTLYSWTRTITGQDKYNENLSIIQGYDPPPADAKPIFKQSTMNGETISSDY